MLAYRFQPVWYENSDLRLTYFLGGNSRSIQALTLRLGTREFPFTLGLEGTEVVVPAELRNTFTDRELAQLLIHQAGVTDVLAEGNLVLAPRGIDA